MNILAVDMGSYSIKFLEISAEKNFFSLISFSEYPLDDFAEHMSKDASLPCLKLQIVKKHLEQREFKGQFISQLPNELITTRYLTIPVTQKRKVEQTIPFQLDESIPFSFSEIHYISFLKKKGNTTSTVISVAELSAFDNFYNEMSFLEITPDSLTSELSAVCSLASSNLLTQPCAILDIGHSTSKGYFIVDNEVLSNHVSYIAGLHLNDVISNTYQISNKEAVSYKHENCFFLTEEEYDTVNKEQMDFALLMKQAFNPLIQDFRSWDMGFNIKYRKKIKNLYITGGSSNIKNIIPFLTQNISMETHHLNVYAGMRTPTGVRQLNHNEKNTFSLSHILASSAGSNSSSNFLKGDYSNKFSENLPLHSTCFIGSRILTVCLLAVLILGIEKSILSGQEKKLDKKITRLIKGPSLGIPRKIQKSYKKRPSKVLNFLEKKKKGSKKEIKTLYTLEKTNAISPLVNLSKGLSGKKDVDLVSFSNKNNNVNAKFGSSRSKNLDDVAKKLKSLSLKNAKIMFKKGSNTLSVSFKAK
ncbi:MAG: pilus assembly protein PilM [Halobacteriovoraceae bacterium]|nr:pilus assembly protein PilM [Halobacteriovoraceae bacterium]